MDKPSHVLDLVVGGRLMSACWFLASLGCAILHMRLLAQAWHQSGTALEAAVVSSAWLVGTVISAQRRTAAAGNGLLFVTVVLLWLASPAVSWSIAPALHVLATYVGLCVCSFILGFTSTSWLTRPRRFPPVGEQVLLCRGLVGSTVGLVIVWLLPGSVFSAVCGLIVLVPLLLLDVLPQSRSPLPATGGLVERWSAQVVPSTAGRRTGLTLETGALPRGWWISYLAARGQLGLTVLASVFAVVTGATWSSVPTVFAADLASAHQLSHLVWLLGGQLCALVCGLLLLFSTVGRRAFGSVSRLLPESWRACGRPVSLVLLLVMAAALVAVGIFQESWMLATSLYGYTLAAWCWGLLLPRLRPTISTITFACRHSYQEPVIPRILPLRQLEEDLVQRKVGMAEVLGVVIATPLLGELVDHSSVDAVLIFVGCGLIGSLAVATCFFSRSWRESSHTQLERWYAGRGNISLPRPPALPDEYNGHHSRSSKVEA